MDMSAFQKRRWLIEFGVVCLIPIVLLGFFLLETLKANVESRAIANAREQARLVADVGVANQLAGLADLGSGISATQQEDLDGHIETVRSGNQVVRVIARNRGGRVVYSDDHSLIGDTEAPGPAATATGGTIVSTTTTAPGTGKILSVFTPLKLGGGTPA